jgi:hypothetical protein
MSDPIEYSSQIIEEEEDFFLDDDTVQEDLPQIEESKERSFRTLLAGPSGNKVCLVYLF